MNAKLSKLTPVLFAGVAAAGIAVAPPFLPTRHHRRRPLATTRTARPARRRRARKEPVPRFPADRVPKRAPTARFRPVSPVARGLKRGRAAESRACPAARAAPSACPDNVYPFRFGARDDFESPLAPNWSEGVRGSLTLKLCNTYKALGRHPM